MGGFRIKTILFYGILTTITLIAIIMVVSVNSRTKFVYDQQAVQVDVILDAGHGGIDGGAVSESGICEAPINLSISQKTQFLFGFLGKNALMTRSDDRSLDYREECTVRENKNADLNMRLSIAKQYPSVNFLSIHLNQFSDPRYSGAQVFYNQAGESLAKSLQEQLRLTLDPKNQRVCKAAPEGVFLMKNISAPAVTIECGFLSNVDECARLTQDPYQTKIALAIINGYALYLRG